MANYNDYFIDTFDDIGTDNGSFYFSGAAEMGRRFGNGEKCAFRFSNVQVSQGSSVSSAFLRFWVQERGGNDTDHIRFRTFGIRETDTADLSSNPFSRTHTTTFDTTDIVLPPTLQHRNITVTGIVNEIVGQGGWSSGNHMGFLLENNGTDGTAYIYDSTAESLLSILLTANPNFKPTPVTVRVNRQPPIAHYGMRISKKSNDAMSENTQVLNFFSRHSVLKELRSAEKGWTPNSNDESVDHGLKYTPAFLAFYKMENKIYHANANDPLALIPIGSVYSNEETLHFLLDPNADDPQSWFYHIFVDENV